MRRLPSLFLLSLVACGDSGVGGSCDPNGSGSITGTVRTATFGDITTAYEQRGSDGRAVLALSEDGKVCGGLGSGQDLALLFCDAPVATRYDVLSDGDFVCPIAGALAIFEMKGGDDFAESTGGRVTFEAATDDCVRGSFEIDFDGETLTGEFDAVVCH